MLRVLVLLAVASRLFPSREADADDRQAPPTVLMRSPGERWGPWLPAALPVVGLAGFALARLTWEVFYDQLGVPVDALALSNAKLLWFTALVLLTLAGAVAIPVLGAALITAWLRDAAEDRHRNNVHAYGFVVGATLVVLVAVILPHALTSITGVAALAVVGLVLLLGSLIGASWDDPDVRFVSRWTLTVPLVLALLLWAWGLERTEGGARALREGANESGLGLLIDPDLVPVCVHGLGSEQRFDGAYLLLGGQDRHVLLRERDGLIVQIAVEDVVVTSRGRSVGC